MLKSTELQPVTVSVREACRCMGVSLSTFYRRQKKKESRFPKIRKDGGRSLIRVSDIKEWESSLGEVAP